MQLFVKTTLISWAEGGSLTAHGCRRITATSHTRGVDNSLQKRLVNTSD